jgi:hypothetical protein
MSLDVLTHTGAPRGRSMRALYLFRRAALPSRQRRSARTRDARFTRLLPNIILRNEDIPPAARCAVVVTKAQRAT